MQPFIGTVDLEAMLGINLDETDLLVAIALDSACQSVRSYMGQTVNLVIDDEVEIDGNGARTIRLRERPVRDITSVIVDDIELDPTTWNLKGAFLRRIGDVWPVGISNIVVTYSHGWDVETTDSSGEDLEVPADIRLVALLSARRVWTAMGTTTTSGGVSTSESETIGQYSHSETISDKAVVASAAALVGAEEDVLERYCVRLIPRGQG